MKNRGDRCGSSPENGLDPYLGEGPKFSGAC